MHMQPVYEGCDMICATPDKCVCEEIFNNGVCLPSDIKNTQEDMERIISIIRKVFGN